MFAPKLTESLLKAGPLIVSLNPFRGWHKEGDGFSPACDLHSQAFLHLAQELRQVVFGLSNTALLGHSVSSEYHRAIDMAISETEEAP